MMGWGLRVGAALAAVMVVAGCGGSGAKTISEAPATSASSASSAAAPEETSASSEPAASSGSSAPEGSTTAEPAAPAKPVDILRIGTNNYIDSWNPLNYIEGESLIAFQMIWPALLQWDHSREIEGDWAESWETSPDGKDITFKLRPGNWSDGQPMTADDAVWWVNTVLKYKDDATAQIAPSFNHATKAEAPDPQTLVIHYESPVANALTQLVGIAFVPKHVWEPLVGKDGKGLKTFKPELKLPIVGAGPYTLEKYEKKGSTIFKASPDFYGEPKPMQKAVVLNYYTNPDAMLADLKAGDLDWVDEVPITAVDNLKSDPNIEVVEIPGSETTNVTWNSNPKKPKNRELLDPKVKAALSKAIDRDRIISVVFGGHAQKTESLLGTSEGIAGPWVNTDLPERPFDIDAANAELDALGYAKGPDGIRVVPATTGENAQPEHKMSYEIMVPESLNFNGKREFEVVADGFSKVGVKVTQLSGGDSTAAFAIQTGDNCDAAKQTGYDNYDIALWDWIGYNDPDFMLSVVTLGQWCSWSDTGWSNAAYDEEYAQQSLLVDEAERKALVDKMQQEIYDNVLYTQLVEMATIDAHRKGFTGFDLQLNGYSKRYWSEVGASE